MCHIIDNLEKEASYTIALAVKSFLEKNFLTPDKINISILDKNHKVIIRIFDENWNVEKNRDAMKTVYHGWHFDIFTWECNTRTSGTLTFDDVLTDEYRYKCE